MTDHNGVVRGWFVALVLFLFFTALIGLCLYVNANEKDVEQIAPNAWKADSTNDIEEAASHCTHGIERVEDTRDPVIICR